MLSGLAALRPPGRTAGTAWAWTATGVQAHVPAGVTSCVPPYAAAVRVVAGVAGGRRLHAPPGKRVRPTSERVREAIFGSLGSMGAVVGARVLDLFAGSGALGIEALSRGAVAATFVEADGQAANIIRANLLATGLAGTVVRSDVMRFLEGSPERFDLVLADPPYGYVDWPELLGRLPASLAVLESDRPVVAPPGWVILRSRRYGDSVVTFARRPERS